jgi:hypothetical protein
MTLTTDYTADLWNATQREMHESTNLDDALYKASCLAGGWYRRPVRIDMMVTPENTERYSMRPAELPPPDGWRKVYTITAHND